MQFFARARARLRPLLTQHRLRLAVGMKVRIFGRLELYAPSGSLGLTMTDLDPRFTLGDLAQQREQVLRRLVADGSVDANRRRPLGPVPLRIGVVSSAGTAAWHDFHDELERSGFGFQLVLADTRVQGPTAARRVTRAVESLTAHHRRHGLDVVVLIRGGGARNELAVFDAEPIARAIAACPVPVWTGLGHEVDRSVADECAHTSFKTPTACAVALVQAVAAYLQTSEQAYAAVLARAGEDLAAAERRLVERAHRIARRTHAAVERADERLAVRVDRLRSRASGPLREADGRIERQAQRLAQRVPQLLAAEARHLDGLEARVRALDPALLLARGWTITRTGDGARRAPARRRRPGRRARHPARRWHDHQPRRTRRKDHAVTAPADTPGYARALDELDEILRELEGTDVDVDRLADRVARATELIALCRDRIGAARLRIDEVIADLDGPLDGLDPSAPSRP